MLRKVSDELREKEDSWAVYVCPRVFVLSFKRQTTGNLSPFQTHSIYRLEAPEGGGAGILGVLHGQGEAAILTNYNVVSKSLSPRAVGNRAKGVAIQHGDILRVELADGPAVHAFLKIERPGALAAAAQLQLAGNLEGHGARQLFAASQCPGQHAQRS